MPITLGCPSCGKRFRARDESAGKRVKCPYCAAAVSVPTAEEAGASSVTPVPPAAAPMAPSVSVPTPRGAGLPPAPAPVAPGDWGAAPSAPPPADPNPFGGDATKPPPAAPLPLPSRPGAKKPAAKPAAKVKPESARTPEQVTAAAWRKTRGGLGLVLFGLFFLAIPGFVGFGKTVYTRAGNNLPQGEGWVSVPGYVNDDKAVGAVKMDKPEQLDVALYAVPVVLGGLFLTFGRLTAGAAPRNSGASGLFAFSGLFTLLALACLVTAAACDRLLFKDTYLYTAMGFLVLAGAAEFWFLNGLTACGSALKRPAAARAVGLVGFFGALAAAVPTVGWRAYTDGQWNLRPKPLTDDWLFYEQAALMIGWLLLIGVYWRAVRNVRLAIRDHLETAPV